MTALGSDVRDPRCPSPATADLAVVSDRLSAVGDTVAAWAAGVLAPYAGQVDALHVASPDMGAREALGFWAAAQTVGVGRATPAAFPWTLANSPTGRVSQALGITGPCTTWVGPGALEEAWLAARDDVQESVADVVLVVALRGTDDIGVDGGPTRIELTAWVLGPGTAPEPPRGPLG